eukprot:Em0016g634a
MATPNTAPSDNSTTTTLMGGGAQSSGDTSRSPYKLVYGMEEDGSDKSLPTSPSASGTLTQLTSARLDPGNEKPLGAATVNGLGSRPRADSASINSCVPSPQVREGSLAVGVAADGRPPSERAESPLSLTDVRVEDVGPDPPQPGPALATIVTNTTSSSLSLSSKADVVRPNLPPPYGILPPSRPPPYASFQHPHETCSLPPYTPSPLVPMAGGGGSVEYEQLPTKTSSHVGISDSPLPAKVQPQDLEESVYTVEMVSFPAMTYLGNSAVDAPRSENEASRKMEAMREQAVDALQVILKVPVTNEGSILLLDPQNQLALLKFPIRYILFCARGKAESTTDCLCINVRLQSALSYHCHVFKAPNPETCQKVFDAIGKSFRIGMKECEFHVKVEIHEDDGRGSSSPVLMEKDCFRLRPNVNKMVVLTLSQFQSETSKPLHIER